MKQRLDKMISHMGLGSRKDAELWGKQGKILVNGKPARSAQDKADPDKEDILVCGQPLAYREFHYLMLYKPAGVLTATEDKKQKTVMDLLPEPYASMGLFPAGRLDKDTTGLLLLTNDGTFSHRLMSPRYHMTKIYEAKVAGQLTEEDICAFAQGLVLEDGTQCMPADLEIQSEDRVRVHVQEGKYHQVKRMLASRGAPVIQLHRSAIGSVRLDEALSPGEFRLLTEEEWMTLQSAGKNSQ